jgi:putative ABC transport system ATP-binding protein
VVKSYAAGGTEFQLSIPRLDIRAGAKLAFVGESGCGKSTLLEMLAMILRPSNSDSFRFSPVVDDATHDVGAAWEAGDADQLADLRSQHIGYVLQNGGLLPYLTVRENINLSRRLLHRPLDQVAERWAVKLKIEPTAAVDPVNAARITDLVAGLADELGVTLIVASHAHQLMQRAGLRLIDHRIEAVGENCMHVSVPDVKD